jgi:opacity protein-like surface antigen
MKKLLTMVALLAAFSSFGQVSKWVKPTHYTSTSEMVWSQVDQQFLFFDNKDYHEQGAVWEITLDESTGEGFITSGSITYRVNKTTIEERDGISMVVMNAYNERINAPVIVIASTINGMFKLGVFVESHKKVYYFYE